MMSEKGYTVIELMAVGVFIIILGIIGLIAYISIHFIVKVW